MTWTINRVVVIGSGTMGGGIAAHFANAGIRVHLMDLAPRELSPEEHEEGLKLADRRVRNRIVRASLERFRKHTPPAFFTPAAADLITLGNLDDDEAFISEGDWIIEAIVESLEPKQELVARIDRLRKPKSIVTSNTSGIPIQKIAANASRDFKLHFLGTHFFNPPRYMKLLEVIPTRDTGPDVLAFVREFAAERLGKSVVICKDTPNFIANRLASVSGATVVDFALANNYTVEETDAIAGPVIGRPKTAAFRLQDLVGLDIASAVASNLYGLIEHDESREVLNSPRIESLRDRQIEKGRLGDKTGQGFYRKGGEKILSLDLVTGEYRERVEPRIPSLDEALKIRDTPSRLKFVLKQDDKAGKMARHVVYNALGYAARRIPEISDDISNIDRAVRWGFSHDLGPFETWDALGVSETAEAMEAFGVAVAPWVRQMLAAGTESFYLRQNGELRVYDPALAEYVKVSQDPKAIVLSDLKKAGRLVRENRGASLIDLGHSVLCLEFHTKLNTLDAEIVAMLLESIQEVEQGNWKGLVIGNDGNDFCAGADPAGMRAGNRASTESAVRGLQDALMKIRFCRKPVVAAPFGRTLGAGVEVTMVAARIVVASETYMGLVEVAVGLIPAGGGCKELIRRVVSPPMHGSATTDPLPLTRKVLKTIGTARVSTSAEGARSMGFISETDRVVMNREYLLHEAKREVLALADQGHEPPVRERTCFAAGAKVLAKLRAEIGSLERSGTASAYDAWVSNRLAYVLCGGDSASGEWMDEQFLLDLERSVFVELSSQKRAMSDEQ